MSIYPTNGDYYSKFGLDTDPFLEEIQGDLYFITPELNHRTELIKHLLEFSQQPDKEKQAEPEKAQQVLDEVGVVTTTRLRQCQK